MKFKIKNQAEQPEEEIEFWLEVDEDGDLILKAKKGYFTSYLIRIKPDMSLHKAKKINYYFGFNLNQSGQIIDAN